MKNIRSSKTLTVILAVALFSTVTGCSSTQKSETKGKIKEATITEIEETTIEETAVVEETEEDEETTTTEITALEETTAVEETEETTTEETAVVEETEETKETTTAETIVDEETTGDMEESSNIPVPLINPNNDYVTSTIYIIDLSESVFAELNPDYGPFEREFYVPQFNFDTESAKEVNTFITDLINDINSQKDEFYYTSNSFCYEYKNYITLAFGIHCDWDFDMYYMWTFDVTTGELVSNEDIFSASNSEYSSITEAATEATTFTINSYYIEYDSEPVIVDGALNSDCPLVDMLSESLFANLYDLTFNDENLNDEMSIGLDSNGTLIFISDIFSFGGANCYEEIYTADGHYISDFFFN